jgi:hypothetical protein
VLPKDTLSALISADNAGQSMGATRSFDVFRLRTRPDLCCAVAEGSVRPDFLDDDQWEHAGVIVDDASAPPGFAQGAARYAIDLQGFYVFRWSRPLTSRQLSRWTMQSKTWFLTSVECRDVD